jgi:LacI family transcriptional regulator
VGALEKMLDSSKHATAIITQRDADAPAIFHTLRKKGFSVPGDLSIVGFDNIALAEQVEVPLTTVSQRIPEMAARAVELLRDLCDRDPSRPGQDTHRQIILEPELVIRASTAGRRNIE